MSNDVSDSAGSASLDRHDLDSFDFVAGALLILALLVLALFAGHRYASVRERVKLAELKAVWEEMSHEAAEEARVALDDQRRQLEEAESRALASEAELERIRGRAAQQQATRRPLKMPGKVATAISTAMQPPCSRHAVVM